MRPPFCSAKNVLSVLSLDAYQGPWLRPLALAREASWARTTPPLFDFSGYREGIDTIPRSVRYSIYGEGVNSGLSSYYMETAAGCIFFKNIPREQLYCT